MYLYFTFFDVTILLKTVQLFSDETLNLKASRTKLQAMLFGRYRNACDREKELMLGYLKFPILVGGGEGAKQSPYLTLDW